MSTTETSGELVILEFKRMSCVTDQHVKRARNVVKTQYVSIKSALERTLNRQGWTVNQRNVISGVRSLNEKDLHDNLVYFKVPHTVIESIRSKLAFKIFDGYTNILKDMYNMRFNECPKDNDTHDQIYLRCVVQLSTTPLPSLPSSHHSISTSQIVTTTLQPIHPLQFVNLSTISRQSLSTKQNESFVRRGDNWEPGCLILIS